MLSFFGIIVSSAGADNLILGSDGKIGVASLQAALVQDLWGTHHRYERTRLRELSGARDDAAGAGVEAMLGDHWLLRGEWLHADLGTFSSALSSNGTLSSFQTTTWSRSEKFDQFRAALSYKF